MPSLPGRSGEWTIEYLPLALVAAAGIALALRDRRDVRTGTSLAAIAWNGLWLAFAAVALVTLWGEKF